MKTEDRKRESVANAEMTQSLALLKLGARGLAGVHERRPEQRAMIKTWVEAHRRWHEEVWDELLGKVCVSDVLVAHPQQHDDVEVRKVLERLITSAERMEQAMAGIRDIVQTRPELRPWAIDTVGEIQKSVRGHFQTFGQQIIAVRYLDRLESAGHPLALANEAAEPTRPLEPPPVMDAEYAAWLAAHPEHAIMPKAGPEDFVIEHPGGGVTRVCDIAPLYQKFEIDRPWGCWGTDWAMALIEDITLARGCSVGRFSTRHLEWWMAPLQKVIDPRNRPDLVDAAKAIIARVMQADPLLITLVRGNWIPTHHAHAIVDEKLLPQWPTFNGNGGGQ